MTDLQLIAEADHGPRRVLQAEAFVGRSNSAAQLNTHRVTTLRSVTETTSVSTTVGAMSSSLRRKSLVNGLRGALAGTGREDHGGGARDRIAAGECECFRG